MQCSSEGFLRPAHRHDIEECQRLLRLVDLLVAADEGVVGDGVGAHALRRGGSIGGGGQQLILTLNPGCRLDVDCGSCS